jgi:hypothetical protein
MLNFKSLVPFAVLTYILFVVTILMGVRVIRVSLKVHRLFGFISIGLATIHAIVMIYITYFCKPRTNVQRDF